MTERALRLTGIGGQGVQLAARTLGVAAASQGLSAMVFGEYAGMMRGGNTDATVVIGTRRLVTPPTVSRPWGAIAMHHEFWADVERRMSPGGVVIVDGSVFRGEPARDDLIVVTVEATAAATGLGNARGGSMVTLGALAAATGVVTVESLEAAAGEVLPSYRAQHAEANAAAIRAGYELVAERATEAWPDEKREAEVGAGR
ncbi:2-oxoacid:acceptor oxidoreductase family protein [Actinomadura rugatobispora]|uniref:2-oxoacid:acceptor oxidoreductase family protein n=1 Tax=Actinomadura rugatobispora TaxID=1994 RepID=A0ABW1A8D4_9ACTN|nr:2-oxoacid:ferredoxin oxidoreductase subunit gamma [Actinomadura rugatobispora]